MSTHSRTAPDYVQLVLHHCNDIVYQARFVQQSLPNAEEGVVEKCLHQLHAVHATLTQLDDPWISLGEINCLIDIVLDIAVALQEFKDRPLTTHRPPTMSSASTSMPTAGRPRYIIDLDRAQELHDMELSWKSIATAMGISRSTLYNRFAEAGRSTSRRALTDITDDDLDVIVKEISMSHPLDGSVIVRGHLEAMNIHVSSLRVQESLKRVDAIGVSLRWHGTIKRRVYKVRGSNALWHQDGNEKLRPWGFYVHGCVDGHSRLAIYLKCSNNKRSLTVERLFLAAVAIYGWPSRVRGDFGTENNGIERRMIERWGELHRAYLRGRQAFIRKSIHNVRIERLWRDVRKDALEFFRTIFLYLEEIGLLDMESWTNRIALYIVFQPRIQHWLDNTVASWNLHKVRTAGNKSPLALYQISRETAMSRGYWTGDPGDNVEDVDPSYGVDSEENFPPPNEIREDPEEVNYEQMDKDNEHRAGIYVNDDEDIATAKASLNGIDLSRNDGNSGIDIYCEVVARLLAVFGGN